MHKSEGLKTFRVKMFLISKCFFYPSSTLPLAHYVQERSEAERRGITGLVVGFDEDQTGGAQNAQEGERPGHITNFQNYWA